jgi:hypothetical protein
LRRTEVLWAVLGLAAQAAAQGLQPLPPNVPARSGPPPRVAVFAHESLDPDRLRAFGRPGVTLWLETSSNTLKASTVEHLARFDEAWVGVRSPLKPVDAEVFAKLPRVGVWSVDSALSEADARRVPGVRRVALELTTPLDEELVSALGRRRLAQVLWRPKESPDLLAWGLFRQLPGKKIFAPPGERPGCPDGASGPTVEIHLASLLIGGEGAAACGKGAHVVLTPDAAPWMIDALLAKDPSAELVLKVGGDDGKARSAARFLDSLGLGPFR